MATVREKNGKLFIDYRVNGKRRNEFLRLDDTRDNRKIAELRRKEIEYEIASGIHKERFRKVDQQNKLLKDGYDEFISDNLTRKKSTIISYNHAFNKLIDFTGNVKLKNISKDTFKALEKKLKTELLFGQEKTLSDNTIATYFHRLRIIFKFFKEKEYIKEIPVPRKEVKPKEIRILTDKEIENILDKLKTTDKEHLKEIKLQHYRTIVMLLLTGLRISELVNLKFDDIDFRENLIKVRNEKKGRIDYLPLYDELKQFILSNWKIRTGALFKYKSKDSMKFFRRFLEKEKIVGYSFHTLRKTFISKLINSGLSVYDVMTLARHKDLRTTLRHYAAADLQRMGKEISFKSNLGTLVGTKTENQLKIVKFGSK